MFQLHRLQASRMVFSLQTVGSHITHVLSVEYNFREWLQGRGQYTREEVPVCSRQASQTSGPLPSSAVETNGSVHPQMGTCYTMRYAGYTRQINSTDGYSFPLQVEWLIWSKSHHVCADSAGQKGLMSEYGYLTPSSLVATHQYIVSWLLPRCGRPPRRMW